MSAQDFWERRKERVRAQEHAEKQAKESAAADARAVELEAMDDATALAELGLPDPNLLGPGDDFSVFMRLGVPEKFKRVALRRLWRSNPVLANIDGLNDYDDDYRTQALGQLGQVLKTSYKVGKGLMAHVEEMQRQAEAADAADEPDAGQPDADVPVAPAEQVEPVALRAEAPANETCREHASEGVPEQTEASPRVARRMQFSFEQEKA